MATYRDTYSAHVSFNNFTLFQDNAIYRVINNANETPRNTCGKYDATIHVHVNSCVKAFLIRYIHIYTHTNEQLCTRP